MHHYRKMVTIIRQPRVNNKYKLTIAKIKKMNVIDRNKVCSPLFWRNDIINAWCLSGYIGTKDDIEFGTYNSYWIGIYDGKDKIKADFNSYGGMCRYNFNSFYKEKDMENENDLRTQELFLETINKLIDDGIIA